MTSVACEGAPGQGTYALTLSGYKVHLDGHGTCANYTQYVAYRVLLVPQADGTLVYDNRPWEYLQLDAEGRVVLLEEYNALYGDYVRFTHAEPLVGAAPS